MSTLELESWLSKVKDFSVNELIAAQETILQELKQKTQALQAQNTDTPTNSSQKPASQAIANDVGWHPPTDLKPKF